MKANLKSKKVKVDWKVRAFCDEEERNEPECVIEYRTLGYDKFGKGEIVVIGRVKNAEKITTLINTFGRMLAEGENFNSGYNHCIDDENGNTEFTFGIVYGDYGNGDKWIQLLPDFEWGIFKDCDSDDCEEQIVYLNNRKYALLETEKGKKELCRVDKLVWKSFVDDKVDIFDDSWELGYKDGDYKNCALDNLYLVKNKR